MICRRHDSAPATEVAAPLPADRVCKQRPFAVVGIDHAGPVLVKDGDKSRKAWIVLFVCATSRAVHLDLVLSLHTKDVIHAYRRFVARYGEPQVVRSDNGTAFTAAARMLDVDWRFNPPASPWHGGFYERLVAAVKSPLRRVLGRALVCRDEMATLLAEVECIVNDRPLTHVGGPDEPQPLTPNLLLGRVVGSNSTSEVAFNQEALNNRLKYLVQLRRHLADRWTHEYLLTLQGYQATKSHTLQEGSVVLVVSEQKRQFWRMAVIVKLFPGRDGKIRVARVRVGKNEFLRPIQRLVPLEVTAVEPLSVPESSTLDVAPQSENTTEQEEGNLPVMPSPSSDTQVLSPPGQHTRTRLVKPRDRLDL